MLEHLSNPEYLHVLLNPLPVYGLGVGAFGLVIALISRSRAARVTALALVLISSLSAWPVYHYGEEAYNRVLSVVDRDGLKWLDEHQRRGEQLIYLFYAVAALAGVAIGAEFKFRRAAVPLGVATLVLATVDFGIGSYIAYAGGRIRHKEFRYDPPPATQQNS